MEILTNNSARASSAMSRSLLTTTTHHVDTLPSTSPPRLTINRRRRYPSTPSLHGPPRPPLKLTVELQCHVIAKRGARRKYLRIHITLAPPRVEGCGCWGRHVTPNQATPTPKIDGERPSPAGASSTMMRRRRGVDAARVGRYARAMTR